MNDSNVVRSEQTTPVRSKESRDTPTLPPMDTLTNALQRDELALSYFVECVNTIDIGLGTDRAENFARASIGLAQKFAMSCMRYP